ncbi:hypothetical protein LSTR_LSTR002591 [Laodelphax striatellus]|uniref:Uncharacterized protein n=1 Tax=Laodelphax striatellus TaxID=195883 RepID=A0A482XN05_LAOST|nr:hypothetical protein LSTR_LSTR002591 [Laodelphax striatellus]
MARRRSRATKKKCKFKLGKRKHNLLRQQAIENLRKQVKGKGFYLRSYRQGGGRILNFPPAQPTRNPTSSISNTFLGRRLHTARRQRKRPKKRAGKRKNRK